ncbi:MAG: GNAT family N-acetyltransferase [Clostridia bacterium]|nr:GNAT family N-acetyltransferase [Clostridia bacterium]
MFLSFLSPLPVLETDRLKLRPLRMADAHDLFDYAQDPQVSKHVLWRAHTSIQHSRQFIREIRRQYRSGFPGSFAIEWKAQRKMIGTIGYMWLNHDFHSCEIGYSLSRDYWNKGIMTEALKEVIRYTFETMHINRIEAMYEVDNPASGRVMEKAGMRYEGTLRQRVRNKEHYSDVRIYAILADDFKATEGHVS